MSKQFTSQVLAGIAAAVIGALLVDYIKQKRTEAA